MKILFGEELLISWLALAAPTLAPDQHRHAHQHGQHDQDAVEGEGPAVVCPVNEVLYREGNDEVDDGGAAG